MKTVAVIQARMNSTRLPGKVLMDIAGQPMLAHVVRRLTHSSRINEIVVALTTDTADDVVEMFCRDSKIKIFRGESHDVLDRYYQTARSFQADCIVRITSDCPLIDPQVVDHVIREFKDTSAALDGATNCLRRTYPRGLDCEVFGFSALERCWRLAEKDYCREHVTIYMYEHPELFKMKNVEYKEDLSFYRWTVDEELDLKLVREIYLRLRSAKEMFFMQDILEVFERDPALKHINEHVLQKHV